jgi:hypothetical protein
MILTLINEKDNEEGSDVTPWPSVDSSAGLVWQATASDI